MCHVSQVLGIAVPFRSTALCFAVKLFLTMSQHLSFMMHADLNFFRDDTWGMTLLEYFVRVAVPTFVNHKTMEWVMERQRLEEKEEKEESPRIAGDDAAGGDYYRR